MGTTAEFPRVGSGLEDPDQVPVLLAEERNGPGLGGLVLAGLVVADLVGFSRISTVEQANRATLLTLVYNRANRAAGTAERCFFPDGDGGAWVFRDGEAPSAWTVARPRATASA